MKVYINSLDRKIRLILIVVVLMIYSAHIYSQTIKKDSVLNRTIIVENEYNPDIMDASKINILPTIEEPIVSPKDIKYSIIDLPTTTFGTYYPMASFIEKQNQTDPKRGYARLGYGNYGNVDMKLNYLFLMSEKDRLGISLILDGMNGKLKLAAPFGINIKTVDWKSRFYSSELKLNYEHLFRRFKMEIVGNLGMNNFNYHQLPVENEIGNFIYLPGFKDNQHQMKGLFRGRLISSDETLSLQFSLQADYSYFSKKYILGNKCDDKEQIATLKADVWGQIDEQQKVGLKVDLNSYFYSIKEYDNYTSLEANPYYMFRSGNWALKVGAHVDFSFRKENKIELAPDIDIEYAPIRNYALYLKVFGGRVLNDYNRFETIDPYWAIYNSDRWKNTYIPVDASLGFKSSLPFGLGFNLFVGYKISNDELCFGNFSPQNTSYAYSYVQTANQKGLYTGLKLTYLSKDYVALSAHAIYYRWNNSMNEFLLMKPELELKLKADIKLMSTLYINLGYEFVSRSKVLLNQTSNFPEGSPREFRMKPVNNLSLGLTYNCWKNLSVYVRLNNLLNREYQYNYSYPIERLNFLAGLSVKF